MRYIIETNNHEAISQLVESNQDTELITQYEPVERLTARVEKMKQAFDEFRASRGNWRIMNYYLRGRGIAQNEIDTVLNGLEEFFQQIERK